MINRDVLLLFFSIRNMGDNVPQSDCFDFEWKVFQSGSSRLFNHNSSSTKKDRSAVLKIFLLPEISFESRVRNRRYSPVRQ